MPTAVIFPGVGYTKDRPILYYAGKLAIKHGYDLIHIDFGSIRWDKDKIRERDFPEKTLEECLKITENALGTIDLSGDDRIVFISKSIGTVVATAYAKKKPVAARQLLFSPLEMIGEFATGGEVMFCSDDDPYADFMKMERIAKEKDLVLHRIAGANHSLETGEIITDIDNLKMMMQCVDDFL